MTTPQNQLYYLAEQIKRLTDMFENEEGEESIFDTVKQMQLEILDIITNQQRLENQLNLIIKLLGKPEC